MKLFYTEINTECRDDELKKILSLLPRCRAEAARRYVRDVDVSRSIAASLLLAQAVRLAGYSPQKIRLERNAWGKPYCADIPGWHFNLAHAGQYAACIHGYWEGGIDLETANSVQAEMIKAALHPDEKRICAGMGDNSQVYTRLWVGKEAVLKAFGTGLGTDPAGICVLEESGNLKKEVRIGGKFFRLREYVSGGFILAACVPQNVDFPTAEYWSWEKLAGFLND